MCRTMWKSLVPLVGKTIKESHLSAETQSLSHRRSSDPHGWVYDTHNELQFSQKNYKILLTQEKNLVHIYNYLGSHH